MKTQDLQRRVMALMADRKNVESRWDAIERYVMPYRGQFFNDENGEATVDWRTRYMYDSTAVDAADKLASSMHGSLTSNVNQWFKIVFRDSELNGDNDARTWLEKCTEIIYLALKESNFDVVAPEAYHDLVGFGSSSVMEEIDGTYDAYKGLIFTCIAIRECFFEMDAREKMYRFYRVLKWTPLQILDKFGEDCPQDIREKAQSSEHATDRIQVVYAIWRRDDVKVGDASKPLAPELRPFGTRYFLLENGDSLGKEDGCYEMPGYVLRWSKHADSQWGTSPAMKALADIMTLNALVELTLKAADVAVDPPINVKVGATEGKINRGAGQINYVHDQNAITAFLSGARFDVSAMNVENLKEGIKRMFHIHELELKESPAMTATEVTVRYELLQKLLGTTLGRLQSDFLNPMIERTFAILYRANQLPPAPEPVANRQAHLDIEYIGPLSRIQKSDEVNNAERFLAILREYAEQWPELLDVIEPIETALMIAGRLQVPATMTRKKKDIEAKQEERRQREQDARDTMYAEQADKATRAGKQLAEMQEKLGSQGMGPAAEAMPGAPQQPAGTA